MAQLVSAHDLLAPSERAKHCCESTVAIVRHQRHTGTFPLVVHVNKRHATRGAPSVSGLQISANTGGNTGGNGNGGDRGNAAKLAGA